MDVRLKVDWYDVRAWSGKVAGSECAGQEEEEEEGEDDLCCGGGRGGESATAGCSCTSSCPCGGGGGGDSPFVGEKARQTVWEAMHVEGAAQRQQQHQQPPPEEACRHLRRACACTPAQRLLRCVERTSAKKTLRLRLVTDTLASLVRSLLQHIAPPSPLPPPPPPRATAGIGPRLALAAGRGRGGGGTAAAGGAATACLRAPSLSAALVETHVLPPPADAFDTFAVVVGPPPAAAPRGVEGSAAPAAAAAVAVAAAPPQRRPRRARLTLFWQDKQGRRWEIADGVAWERILLAWRVGRCVTCLMHDETLRLWETVEAVRRKCRRGDGGGGGGGDCEKATAAAAAAAAAAAPSVEEGTFAERRPIRIVVLVAEEPC